MRCSSRDSEGPNGRRSERESGGIHMGALNQVQHDRGLAQKNELVESWKVFRMSIRDGKMIGLVNKQVISHVGTISWQL